MRIRRNIGLLCLFYLLPLLAVAQNDFSVLIVNVSDSSSELPVRKVNILIPSVNKMIKTDNEGQVRFGLPNGRYLILAEHNGYNMHQAFINIEKDTSINIILKPLITHYNLGEVSISALRFNKAAQVISGLESLNPKKVLCMPSLGAEKDIIKTLSTLPGVSTGSEGSADIHVRGGSSDQNLYLLDNNMIYKSSHLFGFLTTINPLGVSSIDFYKAGFPARYGGKLSSVVDIKTHDPGLDSVSISSVISPISGNMVANIPIIKGSTGILISGRVTIYDKIYSLFAKKYQYSNTGFYDTYLKLNHKMNSKNSLNLYIYSDQDYFTFMNKPSYAKEEYSVDKQKWKNRFARIEYNHVLKNVSNIKVYSCISNYKMVFSEERISTEESLNSLSIFSSSINGLKAGISFNSKTDSIKSLSAGVEMIHHILNPANLDFAFSDTTYSVNKLGSMPLEEISSYISSNFRIAKRLGIYTGLRFSFYSDRDNYFAFLEPRISLQYTINRKNSIKSSFSRITQALHMLTNPGLGMPMDIYVPSSGNLRPGISNQIAFEYNLEKYLFGKTMFITIGTYYKTMDNILHYNPGYSSHSLSSNNAQSILSLESILSTGTGYSYGGELLIEKPVGKLNGWISYSLSRTIYQFPGLNNGKQFPAKHHRPNNFNIVLNYNINRSNRITANFAYMSGERITLPEYIYNSASIDFAVDDIRTGYLLHPFYSNSEINAYRMKDFHRLNVSYTHRFSKKKWKGELEFSIYNIYNRRNSYYYHMGARTNIKIPESSTTPTLYSVSLFPVIPAISLKIDLK